MFDEVFVYHKDRTGPNITFFLKLVQFYQYFSRGIIIFSKLKKETLKKLYVMAFKNYMFLQFVEADILCKYQIYAQLVFPSNICHTVKK